MPIAAGKPAACRTLLKSHNEGTCALRSCVTVVRRNSAAVVKLKHIYLHEAAMPYVYRDSDSTLGQFGQILCSKDFNYKSSVVRHFNRCSDKHGSIDIFYPRVCV